MDKCQLLALNTEFGIGFKTAPGNVSADPMNRSGSLDFRQLLAMYCLVGDYKSRFFRDLSPAKMQNVLFV